jgi:hypothetical protein
MSKNDKNPRVLLDALGNARYTISMLHLSHISQPPLLTTKEEWLISKILIGCSKLIYLSHLKGAKKMAQGKYRKNSKRDLAMAALGARITMTDNLGKFTPKAVKNKFPDNLKSIDSSDLSEILGTLTEIGLTKKTSRDLRRGAPKHEEKLNYSTGVPSFYELENYAKELKQLIDKPLARNLIFSYLLQSGLIHRWLDFVCLYSYYQLKFEGPKAWAEVHSLIRNFFPTEQLESFYQKLCSIDDKKLRELANKSAVEMLENYDKYQDLFTNLYLMGGIYFNA